MKVHRLQMPTEPYRAMEEFRQRASFRVTAQVELMAQALDDVLPVWLVRENIRQVTGVEWTFPHW